MYAAALTGSIDTIWADQRVVWAVAAAAVALLTATGWLLLRRSRKGRRAAAVCVTLSVLLHVLLFYAVPLVRRPAGGGAAAATDSASSAAVVAEVTFSDFADPSDLPHSDRSIDRGDAPPRIPLPLPAVRNRSASPESTETAPPPAPDTVAENPIPALPDPLHWIESSEADTAVDQDALDEMLSELWLAAMPARGQPSEDAPAPDADLSRSEAAKSAASGPPEETTARTAAAAPQPATARAADAPADDFAHRIGGAKARALATTGGDETTEAAVAAGLRWLVQNQRPDGSWDPATSGGGQERSPLGVNRGGAGGRATMGLSGMAVLALLGAGNTHRQGEYAEQVHAGLSYLILNQAPDGSLAGNAGTYARTYSHGMAALALCEAAAMTGDAAAVSAARAAVAYTARLQHPTTGGWRYVPGDPGDLSQLGWQVMVLNSGRQAGIFVSPQTIAGASRFLRSVRAGRVGGLASYRAGEAPSRTMTAEALAARLILGQRVPAAEIAEAETYLLAEPPGVGQDNYYYWYYASLALHQLQDDAWRQWNRHLKQRLIASQRADGSWPTNSVWGGYGGSVYTTAIGCMCLEVYYRHGHEHRHLGQPAGPIAAAPAETMGR